jgi:hypothetical protein
VVRYASTGVKSVTSVVHSAVEDPNVANDSATQTTQVDPKPAPTGADLSVTVDGAPAAAQLTNVNYTSTAANAGPLAADAVSLVFDVVSWGEAGDQTVKATVSSTTTDPTAANNSETEHTSVS